MGTEEVPFYYISVVIGGGYPSGISVVLYAFRNGYDYCDEEWGEH